MTHPSPLLNIIFDILAKQGWKPLGSDLPRYRQRGIRDGFMVVSDHHVRTSGVIPPKRWTHVEFVTEHAKDLL